MRPPDNDEGEALLRLALSQPARALSRATALLASRPEPCLASAALQARGIVLRDRGETTEAVGQLQAALVMARRCGAVARVADVRASLGAALVMHGQTRQGLAQLEAAAAEVHGSARATVLMRRAYVLRFLGRHDDALKDLRVALAGFRRAGDLVWEARTLNNRGTVYMALGEIDRAERDVRRAEEMFTAAGQQLEAVHVLHNRALLAHLRGDLPRAFALYDRSEVAYAALGTRMGDLVVDRSLAYLAAGLASDAWELTTRALEGEPLQARHRAQVQLAAATAALAHGDARAETMARQARLTFARQGRTYFVSRCDLVAAQARHAAGRPVRLPELRRVAAELVATRAEESALALLLAGRVALERGADGHAELVAAARYRRNATPQIRAAAWLALALDRDNAGDRAGVLRAARRGLDELAAQRDVLGSTQLRALATRNTAELTTLALRHVLLSGSARDLLTWSERARAAALATPAVRPPHDPVLAGQLAAMRSVARALDEARDRGTPTAELAARLTRLEAAIDQRRRRAGKPLLEAASLDATDPDALAARASAVAGVAKAVPSGTGSPEESRASIETADGRGIGPMVALTDTTEAPAGRWTPPPRLQGFDPGDVSRLAERLGDRVLVELVDVEDVLYAVVLRRGRTRRVTVGSTPAALAAVQRARFALRQTARGRRADLDGAADQLQQALLGDVAGLLRDDPVVLVPPAGLHHAPWALCPSLAERPLTSSPSAARWVIAYEAATNGHTGPATALIAGPGLEGADAEVVELAAEHPGSLVLRGPDATVPAALRAFGDASVVHVAAHGRHRADNPLFSSLQLVDGPLTVHDLEALASMPSRIVLSACDSGVMAAVGNDALLGLAEALQAQGAAGVICAVSEVNDAATRPLMTLIHDALAAGRTPAEALLAARVAARGDLLATATAASFSSLGA